MKKGIQQSGVEMLDFELDLGLYKKDKLFII